MIFLKGTSMNTKVQTVDNEIIYLDNNATTQLDPAVIE